MAAGITERPSPPDPPGGADERAVRGFAVTIAALCTAFLVTLVVQLGAGIEPASFRLHAQTYAVIWPQGWSFFADAADTDQVAAYRLPDGPGDAVRVQQVNASSSDAFGLSRTAMVTNNEIGYLAQEIPAADWKVCRASDAAACFPALGAPALWVESDTFRPAALCGRVGFVRSASDTAGAPRADQGVDAPMTAEALVSCP
jgi:hypothetical protein